MKATLIDHYPRDSYTIADQLLAWKLNSEEDVAATLTRDLVSLVSGFHLYAKCFRALFL